MLPTLTSENIFPSAANIFPREDHLKICVCQSTSAVSPAPEAGRCSNLVIALKCQSFYINSTYLHTAAVFTFYCNLYAQSRSRVFLVSPPLVWSWCWWRRGSGWCWWSHCKTLCLGIAHAAATLQHCSTAALQIVQHVFVQLVSLNPT